MGIELLTVVLLLLPGSPITYRSLNYTVYPLKLKVIRTTSMDLREPQTPRRACRELSSDASWIMVKSRTELELLGWYSWSDKPLDPREGEPRQPNKAY